MAEYRPLLIEIGTEELPPKALRRLMDAFAEDLVNALEEARLEPQGVHRYATPRRLALFIEQLRTQQADAPLERLGPKVEAAYDEAGEPTRAALGFARSCGAELADLEVVSTDKGDRLRWQGVERGQPATDLVPERVENALKGLPIPKRMRWGSGEVQFVRPIHWCVGLLGESVIPGSILGIPIDRVTYGHRFHGAGRQGIEISQPSAYAQILRDQGWVVASFTERREAVYEAVQAQARAAGGEPVGDEALFDEVAGLVEWPVALTGDFDQRFLAMPEEALISSMQGHQRCFPVRAANGELTARFVTVANIESRNPDEVRRGNERVIRPRLADAEFFWHQDRRTPLGERLSGLEEVTFHRRLGTLQARSQRIARLARSIAERIGGSGTAAERAGLLCKCDLTTEMVDEFPELQGIMGGYYASSDGEPEGVARGIAEHYRPAFAGDELPASLEGRAVSIADRADTLVGIFAADGPPSAEKDPFGLRRSAIGLLRCLIEGGHPVSLRGLFDEAAEAIRADTGLDTGGVAEHVASYCHERLRGYYHDQGYPAEVFQAVAAAEPASPLDFHRRLVACAAFRELPEAQTLAEANKRIGNILRRAEEAPDAVMPTAVSPGPDAAEQDLATALKGAWEEAQPHLESGDYPAALQSLARLHGPVDGFFEQVMVMAEDPTVRRQRLELLAAVRHALRSVADLSYLPG